MSECPDIWVRLPEHKGPNHGPSMEDPVVPLSEICTVILFMGKSIRDSSIRTRLGKSSKLGMLFVNREKGLFLSVYVDEKELSEKKQHLDPMWKKLMKDVDLGEPTSFLDHVYLGCTPRECQTSKDLVDDHRNMFESKISTGATEKLPSFEKLGANISSLSYDMEGHAKICVERYCELVYKQLNSCTKSQHHALTTTNSRKIYWRIVKGLLTNCC